MSLSVQIRDNSHYIQILHETIQKSKSLRKCSTVKKVKKQEGSVLCQNPTSTVRLKAEGCRVKNGGSRIKGTLSPKTLKVCLQLWTLITMSYFLNKANLEKIILLISW